MTTYRTTSLRSDVEDIKVVNSFYLLGSNIESKGTKAAKKIYYRPALDWAVINILEKIFKCHEVPILTKTRTMQSMVIHYGRDSLCFSEEVKVGLQRNRINRIPLNWCWRSLLRIILTAKKTKWRVIEQINPGFSYEVQMTSLKLSYKDPDLWNRL